MLNPSSKSPNSLSVSNSDDDSEGVSLDVFPDVEEPLPLVDSEADVALVPLDTLSSEEDATLEVVEFDDWDSFCPCPLPLIPFELPFLNIKDMRLFPPPPRVVVGGVVVVVVVVPPNMSGNGAELLDWACACSAGTTCAIDPNPAAMSRLTPCTPPFIPSSIPSTPGATPAVAVDADELEESEYG